jgi:hypothetical protein
MTSTRSAIYCMYAMMGFCFFFRGGASAIGGDFRFKIAVVKCVWTPPFLLSQESRGGKVSYCKCPDSWDNADREDNAL